VSCDQEFQRGRVGRGRICEKTRREVLVALSLHMEGGAHEGSLERSPQMDACSPSSASAIGFMARHCPWVEKKVQVTLPVTRSTACPAAADASASFERCSSRFGKGRFSPHLESPAAGCRAVGQECKNSQATFTPRSKCLSGTAKSNLRRWRLAAGSALQPPPLTQA